MSDANAAVVRRRAILQESGSRLPLCVESFFLWRRENCPDLPIPASRPRNFVKGRANRRACDTACG
mgnify:CR=1 FL=1